MGDEINHDQRRAEDKELLKEAMKEVLSEKVDEYLVGFAWFSLKSIGGVVVAAMLYAYVVTHGFKT